MSKHVGRPIMGHKGHPGKAKGCTACRMIAARVAVGTNQKVFAKMLDVGQRSLQRWERGETEPPRAYLLLAELLASRATDQGKEA